MLSSDITLREQNMPVRKPSLCDLFVGIQQVEIIECRVRTDALRLSAAIFAVQQNVIL